MIIERLMMFRKPVRDLRCPDHAVIEVQLTEDGPTERISKGHLDGESFGLSGEGFVQFRVNENVVSLMALFQDPAVFDGLPGALLESRARRLYPGPAAALENEGVAIAQE